MAKGSGTSRSSSSGNPRGLQGSTERVSFSTNKYGGFDVRGGQVENIYGSAYMNEVERIVERKYGEIRSGGGTEGAERTAVLTFRDGVDKQTIKDYLNDVEKGVILFEEFEQVRGESIERQDPVMRKINRWQSGF